MGMEFTQVDRPIVAMAMATGYGYGWVMALCTVYATVSYRLHATWSPHMSHSPSLSLAFS